MKTFIKVGVTLGDPNGIGPEIIEPVDLAVFTIFLVDLSRRI